MTKAENLSSESERLCKLIRGRYGLTGRGSLLHEASGIGAKEWENLLHGKHAATPEMFAFWCRAHREDEAWLLTGSEIQGAAGFPFAAAIPVKHDEETAADRLSWVIHEWASDRGESLFEYLEERSRGKIPAAEWRQVLLKRMQPTIEMVDVVGLARPMFVEWIVRGHAGHRQVDPSDMASVSCYVSEQRAGLAVATEKLDG